MATLLVVEASTSAGSVALLRDGNVIEQRDVAMGVSRDDGLLPAIVDVLATAGVEVRTLDAIACGSGPGSFTSLRIAASLCKGLAAANNTPLYALPSLLLAAGQLNAQSGRYVVHSDALRGERFALTVDVDSTGKARALTAVVRIHRDAIDANAKQQHAVAAAVGEPNAFTNEATSLYPHARSAALLQDDLSSFGPVSLAEWEPEYGRLAEAQVKWESDHGQPLPTA